MPQFAGTAGDDSLVGGSGADNLYDNLGGNDTLVGGGGDDYISINRSMGSSSVVLDGGDGNDEISVVAGGAGSGPQLHVDIHGGAGADLVEVFANGVSGTIDLGTGEDHLELTLWSASLDVTLGPGADTISDFVSIGEPPSTPAVTTIEDFTPGAGGDRLDLLELQGWLTNWDQGNPFGEGYMRLVQRGADTVLQVDQNGGGDAYQDLFVFKNVQAGQFTAANLFD